MFKLDFKVPEYAKKISLTDSILLIGSCFSDQMGIHLSDNKFNALSNPFGTIYNPASIFKLLSSEANANDLIESQGVFYQWDSHGSISGLSENETQDLFSQKSTETKEFLSQAQWLVITLGTAIVYEYKQHGIVGNCHKVPANQFKRRMLNQHEILEQFSQLHSYISNENPDLQILFTVSPVRHIKDGLVDNNRSKSILLDAVHTITDNYDNVGYFPSYEILIDELRDYRFYDRDMIHPSEEASEYIWEKFINSHFDKETIDVLDQWKKIKTALHHKPFQPHSEAHQVFLKSTYDKLLKMNEKMDMSVELELLKKQIN